MGCKDPIPAPDPAILVSPEASVSCLYVPLNTATANVVFSWQEALNTDDYLLKVTKRNLRDRNHNLHRKHLPKINIRPWSNLWMEGC